MRKGRVLFFLSCVICMVVWTVGALAAGEVKTERIGNLEYEVPEEWPVSTRSDDDMVEKRYMAGNYVLTVAYVPIKLGRDSLLQDVFLDMQLDKYTSSFDYYQEFEKENYDFEENRGRFRLFQYYDQADETDYGMAVHMMCTGKGIGIFEFRFDAASAAVGDYEGFSKIMDTVRTVVLSDEGEKNLSEPEKEYTKYPAGFYKVGMDIPAGEYIVFSEKNQGYFRVSSDREQNEILFKESFSYNSIITVKEGEYLELSGSYAIPIEEEPKVILSGNGMFKAGLHIPEGSYKLQISGVNPYYCVYSDSRHGDIVKNSNFEDEVEVFVADGCYLLLDECKFMRITEGPVKNYTDSETVKKVQEALNAAGYDCGTPDGILENVLEQVTVYQLVNGLTLTMTITEEVLASLGI